MRIFLNDVILRPSCYNCKAKGGRSGSDLTIADFWGIDQLNPDLDDDCGTSLVLINSEKGVIYFNQCDSKKWDTRVADIEKYNAGLKSVPMHPKRSDFFVRLDFCKSVTSLIDDTLCPPLWLRVQRFSKRMLRKVWHTL